MSRRFSKGSKRSISTGRNEAYVHSSSPSPVKSPEVNAVNYKLMSERELTILDPILQALASPPGLRNPNLLLAPLLQRLQVQDPLVQANPTAKINTFMAAFKTMDLDGSESLDFNEFLSGLTTLGILVDRTKAWDMFRVMDEAHITHCPIDLTGTRLHDLDPPRALGGRLRDAEQRRVR